MTIPLVEHPDSVVIVAVEGDQLVCVRQTRPGASHTTFDEWQELGAFWAVPAYSTEFVHVYSAAGLWAADGSALDDDEDVEVERIPLVGALTRLSDAVSVAALALWLEAR